MIQRMNWTRWIIFGVSRAHQMVYKAKAHRYTRASVSKHNMKNISEWTGHLVKWTSVCSIGSSWCLMATVINFKFTGIGQWFIDSALRPSSIKWHFIHSNDAYSNLLAFSSRSTIESEREFRFNYHKWAGNWWKS